MKDSEDSDTLVIIQDSILQVCYLITGFQIQSILNHIITRMTSNLLSKED